MDKEKAILISYYYVDSQDTWRNMTPTNFLLFKNTKDAKDYILKKYKANDWNMMFNDQEFIKIYPDQKNKPNDYLMFTLIRRELLTKAKIAELVAPKRRYW